jgi:hypothetical protein
MHSYLVREQPKIVPELYEQFTKINKSEIQHFRNLEQQRKVSKPDKAPRPRYNENQRSYPKPVHNIDSDGCGPPKNWERNFGTPLQERHKRTFDQRSAQGSQRGGAPNRHQSNDRGPYTLKPLYFLYHGSTINHRTKIAPSI